MKEGRKPEYPKKTPGDELQKILTICHCRDIPFWLETLDC